MRKVFPYMMMGYGYTSSAIALERGSHPGPVAKVLDGRSFSLPIDLVEIEDTRAFGIRADGALLARPDGIVAWRSKKAAPATSLKKRGEPNFAAVLGRVFYSAD